MRYGKFTAISCAALMITMVLIVFTSAGAEPPVKGPDEKRGHITSDETWAQDYEVDKVVIDEGVTVTVNAGVNLYMSSDTWFYVEGTLILAGTSSESVDILAATNGQTWGRIQSNDTGTLHFENFTVSDPTTAATSFLHMGQPSIFKNGIITGGYQGLHLWSDGGNIVENVTIRNCTQDGIYVNGNIQTTHIKNINVTGVGRGALMFVNSQGCVVEGMVATDYGFYGVYTWEAYGLHLSDIDIGSPGANGFAHIQGIGDYHVTDAIVREGPAGILLNVLDGASVNYTRLKTTSNVNDGIKTFPSSYGSGTFTDCDLQAAINPVILVSSGPHQRVKLVNTTWSWNKPLVTSGDVFLNVSWYLDVQLVNAIDDPINGTLMITPTGSGQELLKILPNGKGNKIEVKDRSIPDTLTPVKDIKYYRYDLLFTNEGNPEDQVLLENISFSNYTYLYQMINLQPVVNLPDSLETDEDVWGEISLDGLMIDPEGESLDIERVSDPNIHVNLIQGGSRLRFRNEVENWFGTGWINLTVSDDEKTTYHNMTVVVHSMNDAPYFIEAPPELILEEDEWTFFNFTDKVADVEGSPIEISFPKSDFYTIEYNEITMNLTIWPAENLNGFLEVEVNLSDGEVWTIEILLLNITSINDAPELNAPENWNITLKKGTQTTINLTSMLFDEDGDDLTIYLDPSPHEHAVVDGFNVTISYDENYTEDWAQIFIIVSDGDLTDASILNVHLTGGMVVDDDDDIIPSDDDDDTIGSIKIIPDEELWNVEAEGDEGQSLFLVIEDAEGGRTSFPLEFSDGKYRAEITAEEAEENDEFWISSTENGEPLTTAPQGNLPDLKEKEDEEPFPIWIVILIIAVLLMITIAVILVITLEKGGEYEE